MVLMAVYCHMFGDGMKHLDNHAQSNTPGHCALFCGPQRERRIAFWLEAHQHWYRH